MAIVIDIADAVVTRLNGATLSQLFTAQRHYVPIHELKELVDLAVSVVPRTLDLALLTRGGTNLYSHVIDIGIQRTIGRGAMSNGDINAAADPLMTLAEEIVLLFAGERITIPNPFLVVTCTNVTNVPIFAAEHLDEMRIFTSVVSLTFKVGR